MGLCTICREADAPGEQKLGDASLCPACGKLFRWLLDHYADAEFSEEWWITPETTFHELSIESLDHVRWLLEAEEQFGVTILERDAERMSPVGDYLRYIRLHGKGKGYKPKHGGQDPLWDRGLDG